MGGSGRIQLADWGEGHTFLSVWEMQAGGCGFLGAGGNMGFLRLSHPHSSSVSRSLV